jgi:hypothetical protein
MPVSYYRKLTAHVQAAVKLHSLSILHSGLNHCIWIFLSYRRNWRQRCSWAIPSQDVSHLAVLTLSTHFLQICYEDCDAVAVEKGAVVCISWRTLFSDVLHPFVSFAMLPPDSAICQSAESRQRSEMALTRYACRRDSCLNPQVGVGIAGINKLCIVYFFCTFWEDFVYSLPL